MQGMSNLGVDMEQQEKGDGRTASWHQQTFAGGTSGKLPSESAWTPINLEILMSKLARAGFMYEKTMYCSTVEEMSVPMHQARVESPDKGCETEEQRATPNPVSKEHKSHVDAEESQLHKVNVQTRRLAQQKRR